MTGKNPSRGGGFTVIEMVIVVLVVGLLLAPIMRLASETLGKTKVQRTAEALETARDALVAFAAANNGCLPFAADYEGGLPDTRETGGAWVAYTDTGTGLGFEGSHFGDLPWADLGLGNKFLDGENLRLQYYVPLHYTDEDEDLANGYRCGAGYRGQQWNSTVTYDGSASNLYVYYTDGNKRKLYLVRDFYPAGQNPETTNADVKKKGDKYPKTMQLKRGPDVKGSGTEKDKMSKYNAFILIAPGGNTNLTTGLSHMRDANHRGPKGTWPTGFPNDINKAEFSATRDTAASSDPTEIGDDTLLVMSFYQYRAALADYGLNMEMVCDKDAGDCK